MPTTAQNLLVTTDTHFEITHPKKIAEIEEIDEICILDFSNYFKYAKIRVLNITDSNTANSVQMVFKSHSTTKSKDLMSVNQQSVYLLCGSTTYDS